jgi:predicted XRE-type DNA-binding protein
MNAALKIEQQILEAIREWVGREHLTQERAAERLGIGQTHLNGLLNGRRRHSINWLLQAWETSGGHCTFEVFRIARGPGNGDHEVQAVRLIP